MALFQEDRLTFTPWRGYLAGQNADVAWLKSGCSTSVASSFPLAPARLKARANTKWHSIHSEDYTPAMASTNYNIYAIPMLAITSIARAGEFSITNNL